MIETIADILNPQFSGGLAIFLVLIKYFFIVLSVGMVISTIYFIVKSEILKDKYLKDALEFTKSTPYGELNVAKNWEKIKKQTEDEDQSERKLAIIEADDLMISVLKVVGFKGGSVTQYLTELNTEIIPNTANLIEAHKARRDLIYDPNYELTVEKTNQLVDIYETTFKYLQLLTKK